jgi:hypothetical protein
LVTAFLPAWLSRMEMHLGQEWEILFCVFVLFPVSDSEMESAKSSSVLAKRSAMDWAWISWLNVSDVFAVASALVSPRKPF